MHYTIHPVVIIYRVNFIRDARDEVLDVSLHADHPLEGVCVVVVVQDDGFVVQPGHLHLVVVPG